MRSFRNIGLSVYGLLAGIIAMYSCKSADSSSPLKKHYYVMQGYRPVALWENNVVAENPFPLSEYEKETLLDSAVQVCQAYRRSIPTTISIRGQRTIVRLISGRRPYKSFSNSNPITIESMPYPKSGGV